MNSDQKKFKNIVSNMLPESEVALKEEEIDEAIESIFKLRQQLKINVTEKDISRVRAALHAANQVRLEKGVAIVAEGHKIWFAPRKASLELNYWERFSDYLINDKEFPAHVVGSMDEVSDKIVDLLGDPNRENVKEQRRGLIIGDVQSGKTMNYSGLICKAVDAGYRTVILLTGTSKDLRRQTQIRLDEAFIGFDSASFSKGQYSPIGVGKYGKKLRTITFTTVDQDFSKKTAGQLGVSLAQSSTDIPMLFVIKKNVPILRNLLNWITSFNQNTDSKIDNSILMIDDEADYASVNTNLPENDPTQTNKYIVELLNVFRMASYVGYTATPYANVFIDPDKTDIEMVHENLFPKDYIFALDSPTDYIGARNIFSEHARHSSMLRIIEDGEDYYPFRHKMTHDFGIISPSLKKAVLVFLIANVIRDLRGDDEKNRTMMINVSRFKDTQNSLKNEIQKYIDEIKSSIKVYAALPTERALQDENIRDLYDTFKKEYDNQLELGWQDIQKHLYGSVLPILTFAINGSSGTKLNYDEYSGGLRAVVVGGQALSRGLTLEGLIVSYLYRNAMAFDTLMQMGRWFGYRKGYEDICRIWMDEDSISWYRKISEATDELRGEVARMYNRNATPLEFGLRVRHDLEVPLILTSRNKMRSAKQAYYNTSLNGKVIETTYLYNDAKRNKANFISVKSLVESANMKKINKKFGAYNVDKDFITHFLESVNVPIVNYLFDPIDISEFIKNYAGKELDKWDVVIESGRGNTFEIRQDENLNMNQRTKFRLTNENKYISLGNRKLGSPVNAAFGLSTEKRDFIETHFSKDNPDKSISSGAYFGEMAKQRNPLAIIYPIELDSDIKSLANFDDIPAIGIAIGIPQLSDEETKYVRYQTNKIDQQLREIGLINQDDE